MAACGRDEDAVGKGEVGKGELGVWGNGEVGGENSEVRRMVMPESELEESCLSLSWKKKEEHYVVKGKCLV